MRFTEFWAVLERFDGGVVLGDESSDIGIEIDSTKETKG